MRELFRSLPKSAKNFFILAKNKPAGVERRAKGLQPVYGFSGSFRKWGGSAGSMTDSDTDGDSRDGATDGARQHDARQATLTVKELQPRRTAYKGDRVPGKAHTCRQPRAPGRG